MRFIIYACFYSSGVLLNTYLQNRTLIDLIAFQALSYNLYRKEIALQISFANPLFSSDFSKNQIPSLFMSLWITPSISKSISETSLANPLLIKRS